MKSRTELEQHSITKYICEICNKEYHYQGEAECCEIKHKCEHKLEEFRVNSDYPEVQGNCLCGERSFAYEVPKELIEEIFWMIHEYNLKKKKEDKIVEPIEISIPDGVGQITCTCGQITCVNVYGMMYIKCQCGKEYKVIRWNKE